MSNLSLISRSFDRLFPFLLVFGAAATDSDLVRLFFLLMLVIWSLAEERQRIPK